MELCYEAEGCTPSLPSLPFLCGSQEKREVQSPTGPSAQQVSTVLALRISRAALATSAVSLSNSKKSHALLLKLLSDSHFQR